MLRASLLVDLGSGEVRARWVSPCGTHYSVRWPRIDPADASALHDALVDVAAHVLTMDDLIDEAPRPPLVVRVHGGPRCRHYRCAICPLVASEPAPDGAE